MASRVPASCCRRGPYKDNRALTEVAAPPCIVRVSPNGAEGLTRPLDLAYWLGLQDSYSTKLPISLKSVVALIRSLEGRDKVTKTIQYACRFLWWYHKTYAPQDKIRGPRFEKMFRASQMARKCFHLFRTLEELEKLQALCADSKSPSWRRNLLMVRAAAMAIYWYYDNTCFLINAKLSSFDQRTAMARDGAAWTLANLISIGLALYDLDRNGKERSRLEDKAAALLKARSSNHVVGGAAEERAMGRDGKVEANGHGHSDAHGRKEMENGTLTASSSSSSSSSSQPQGGDTVAEADVEESLEEMAQASVKRFDLVGDLIRVSCDFLVACNTPGFDLPLHTLGFRLHDGIIGTAGLVSALFAVYKAYPADMGRLRKRRLMRLLPTGP